MRHFLLISVLTIVGLFSIGVGIHQLHGGRCARHQQFEQHVADLCVQAAQRTLANGSATNGKP